MRRTILALAWATPLFFAACDDSSGPTLPSDDPVDEVVERGNVGKAEAPGSCQPADCGDRASIGSCWCDDLCSQYGDCCANKVATCDEPDPQPDPDPDPDPGPIGENPDWVFADVWGVPNLDDDDGTHEDFWQYTFPADDDLSRIELPASVMATVGAGQAVQLQLIGDTGTIRVWHDGQPAVGSAAGANSYTFDPDGAEVLVVEFGDYAARGDLIVQRVSGSNVLDQATIALRAAPLVMNHHLQPSEHTWVVSVDSPGYDNQQMVQTYQSVLGNDFTAINGPSYGWDVWMQDEFEFATMVGGDGQRMDVVIDSIRDRGLDPFAENVLVGPSFIADTWGQPWQATTFDSFGNLEASPPVTVSGVEYPLGRIYYGRNGGNGPVGALRSFLDDQAVQAPFEIQTDWLCVGHVDEISSFVPDPTSPKGFRMLLADVDAGIDILESLPGNMQLPRYGADHGYSTVGQIRNDFALMALNEDIQSDYLDPIRQRFMSELGLTNADIIEVPSLFEHIGCGAAALVPGMVNLIVADGQDGDTHLFVPDPFFRSSFGNQSSDPFIDAFADAMPSSLDLHFVDNWDVYHLGIGEVHCGTNVTRTPTAAWWDAAHLLED